MPKRSKQALDSDQSLPPPPQAFRDYMSLLGKKGGRIAGARRMINLTPKQRSTIARTAARARWNAKKVTEKP